MANGLVDSTVLVDVLRGYSPSALWLQMQSGLAITPIVWLELVAGVPNKVKQLAALKLLAQFEMIYLVQADMDWAMQQLFAYKLSHNIGMMDCLIASVSYRLQLPLYTHNLKHITPLLGQAIAVKPYT